MPSNYTGNPTATQTPGPTPSLDPADPPILALPLDGDARNSASTYQPWKECADFDAFFQKTLNAPPWAMQDVYGYAVTVLGASATVSAIQFGVSRTGGDGNSTTIYIPIRGGWVGQKITHVDIRVKIGTTHASNSYSLVTPTLLNSTGGDPTESNLSAISHNAASAGPQIITLSGGVLPYTLQLGDSPYLKVVTLNDGDILYSIRVY